MGNKSTVLFKHPFAYCGRLKNTDIYVVRRSPQAKWHIIGRGSSPREAWADASSSVQRETE